MKLALRADQPYGEAGQQVLAARTRELFERVDNVLDTDDPERVHKMRVATRRLRAALEVFGACFAGKPAHEALAEVKALAAVLGERRDCDVLIELLDALRRDARRAERAVIDRVIGELREEQTKANKHLAKELRHVEAVGLERRLERLSQ
jgi:CHAD domain-containing protein